MSRRCTYRNSLEEQSGFQIQDSECRQKGEGASIGRFFPHRHAFRKPQLRSKRVLRALQSIECGGANSVRILLAFTKDLMTNPVARSTDLGARRVTPLRAYVVGAPLACIGMQWGIRFHGYNVIGRG